MQPCIISKPWNVTDAVNQHQPLSRSITQAFLPTPSTSIIWPRPTLSLAHSGGPRPPSPSPSPLFSLVHASLRPFRDPRAWVESVRDTHSGTHIISHQHTKRESDITCACRSFSTLDPMGCLPEGISTEDALQAGTRDTLSEAAELLGRGGARRHHGHSSRSVSPERRAAAAR